MKVVTFCNLTIDEPIKTDGYSCIELATILKAVCCVNDVSIFDVKGRRRFADLVTARREYCYLACKLTQLSKRSSGGNSLAVIGKEINSDHATVLSHKKKLTEWLDLYGLREKLELIEKQL